MGTLVSHVETGRKDNAEIASKGSAEDEHTYFNWKDIQRRLDHDECNAESICPDEDRMLTRPVFDHGCKKYVIEFFAKGLRIYTYASYSLMGLHVAGLIIAVLL